MSVFKKIVVFIFIAALLILFIRSEYAWERKIKQNLKDKGYEFISNDAIGNGLRPWHWFKVPINVVYYCNKNDILRLNDSIMVGQVYTQKKGEKEYESLLAFDCKHNLCAFIKDVKNIHNDLESLDWVNYFVFTKHGIINYYCSKSKKYFMVDAYGRDVDISNYILNGVYYLKDTIEGFKSEMYNPNPYIPNSQDDNVIKRDVNYWLKIKYPNESFEINYTLFDKIKYCSSYASFTEPIDYYELKLKPNEKLDTVLLSITFSNNKSELRTPINKIVIHNEIDSN